MKSKSRKRQLAGRASIFPFRSNVVLFFREKGYGYGRSLTWDRQTVGCIVVQPTDRMLVICVFISAVGKTLNYYIIKNFATVGKEYKVKMVQKSKLKKKTVFSF